MKKNMGATDKYIRLFVALILAVLVYIRVIEGTWGFAATAAAFVFLLTGAFGFCPLYTLFGTNTCKRE